MLIAQMGVRPPFRLQGDAHTPAALNSSPLVCASVSPARMLRMVAALRLCLPSDPNTRPTAQQLRACFAPPEEEPEAELEAQLELIHTARTHHAPVPPALACAPETSAALR